MDFPCFECGPVTFDASGHPVRPKGRRVLRRFERGRVVFRLDQGPVAVETALVVDGVKRVTMLATGKSMAFCEFDARGHAEFMARVDNNVVAVLARTDAHDWRTSWTWNDDNGLHVTRVVRNAHSRVQMDTAFRRGRTDIIRMSVRNDEGKIVPHGTSNEFKRRWHWLGEPLRSEAEFRARLPRAADFGTLVSPRVAAHICRFV